MTLAMTSDIQTLLGDKAESLLGFNSPKIPKERLQFARSRFRGPRLHAVRPQ